MRCFRPSWLIGGLTAVLLPAGARIVVVAHYNNSASNKTVKTPGQPGGDMFMPVMQYSVAGASRPSNQQP